MSNTNIDIMDTVKITLNNLLDNLADGERTTVKDLVDKIVHTTGVQVSMVNGIVPMLVHQWALSGAGSIKRGRTGGVIKGEIKERIDPRERCGECHQVLRKITSPEKLK